MEMHFSELEMYFTAVEMHFSELEMNFTAVEMRFGKNYSRLKCLCEPFLIIFIKLFSNFSPYMSL